MHLICNLNNLFSAVSGPCRQRWTPLCLNSSSSFSSRAELVPFRPFTTSQAHTKYSWTLSAVQPAKHTHTEGESMVTMYIVKYFVLWEFIITASLESVTVLLHYIYLTTVAPSVLQSTVFLLLLLTVHEVAVVRQVNASIIQLSERNPFPKLVLLFLSRGYTLLCVFLHCHLKDKLAIFCVFLFVDKSTEMNKTDNELILLTSTAV